MFDKKPPLKRKKPVNGIQWRFLQGKLVTALPDETAYIIEWQRGQCRDWVTGSRVRDLPEAS